MPRADGSWVKQSGVIDLFVIRGLLEKAYWSAVMKELWSIKSVLARLSFIIPYFATFDVYFLDCLTPPTLDCFSFCLGSCAWLWPTYETLIAVPGMLLMALKFD